ncbi:peptidase C14, caspase domain-containing protein [Auriculariales sp. MPI-PUGE-AT-0066]|nr:peptidase C14, caspase domain-containing protein [Auriculariales sp. MPI-PUGE-AT-0066]
MATITAPFTDDALTAGVSAKKALLIGIKYADQPTEMVLDATYKDVDRVQRLLMDRFGYNPSDIIVMKDWTITKTRTCGLTRRTWSQMQMKRLVSDVGPNHHRFFMFSGHGIQPDGQQYQAIQPYDSWGEDRKPIPDRLLMSTNLFQDLIGPLPPHDCTFTALVDCCWSKDIILMDAASLHSSQKARTRRSTLDMLQHVPGPAPAPARQCGDTPPRLFPPKKKNKLRPPQPKLAPGKWHEDQSSSSAQTILNHLHHNEHVGNGHAIDGFGPPDSPLDLHSSGSEYARYTTPDASSIMSVSQVAGVGPFELPAEIQVNEEGEASDVEKISPSQDSGTEASTGSIRQRSFELEDHNTVDGFEMVSADEFLVGETRMRGAVKKISLPIPSRVASRDFAYIIKAPNSVITCWSNKNSAFEYNQTGLLTHALVTQLTKQPTPTHVDLFKAVRASITQHCDMLNRLFPVDDPKKLRKQDPQLTRRYRMDYTAQVAL